MDDSEFNEDHDPDDFLHDAEDSSRLYDLLSGGNPDVTIAESKRFLKEDPDNLDAHFCLAVAYVDSERIKDARPHLDFLMNSEPEAINTHLAAITYFQAKGQMKQVHHHAHEGMRIAPEMDVFYFYAAIAETSSMRFKQARYYLDQALAINPNDPDYRNLKIRLSTINETSAEDSWRRVDELQDALAQSPENHSLHNSLGDVFLDELDDPAQAEHHYREALRALPRDHDYQRDLFNAVGQRDLLYRVLSIPSRTFTWLGHLMTAIRHQPWRLIFLVIGFKLVIGFFLWLTMVTVLFWPSAKVYEWFLISEIRTGARASLTKLRWWHRFHRMPRAIRFLLFTAITCGLYSAIFAAFSIPLKRGFTILGITIGIHFIIVFLFWIVRKIRAHSGKRNRERQKRRQQPPPLPSER